MRRLLILAATLFTLACTDKSGARRVLEQNGYKNIKLGGWAAFTCADGDDYATAFSATSPSGHAVTGAVCSGVFKGSTIRFD